MVKIIERFEKLLSHWLAKRLYGRQDCAKMVFMRKSDGARLELAMFCCTECKNFFFFTHAEVEIPVGCPYCLQQFAGVQFITPEEGEKLAPL